MSSLLFVLPWVLASAVISMIAGYFLGRSTRPATAATPSEDQKAATLRVLSNLLTATEQLTNDVNLRNIEIREVGQHLVDMELDGELLEVQEALFQQVSSVLSANARLEDDLTYTRSRMEEQAEEIDRTRKESRTDALSGVGNRKALDEKLKLMLVTWRREQRPFVLVLCDVDHFKWINDTHGHQAGDMVVTRVGEFLRACMREEDFVGRFGGDEFAMLFTDVDADRGATISERIRKQIAVRDFDLGPGAEKASVTFSIGVAACWDGATAEEMLRRADKALYRSKSAGRNKVHLYQAEEEVVAVTAGA